MALEAHVSRLAGTSSLHCTDCGAYLMGEEDLRPGDDHPNCPDAEVASLDFDLTVVIFADGSAQATLTDPGGFSLPLAEAEGPSATVAVTRLVASLDFDVVGQ